MVVRMFAILLALGMLVISTQPTDLATPDTAAWVGDAADDVPPAVLVDPPSVVVDQPPSQLSPPPHRESSGRRSDSELFRPPRAVAFA